eukprot:254994_1
MASRSYFTVVEHGLMIIPVVMANDPYSSNAQHDTLSRSFECQHDSTLNVSFPANADCFFDADDSLRVSINDIPNASELVQNESMRDDQCQYYTHGTFNCIRINV